MESLHSGRINKSVLNSPEKLKTKYETQSEETVMRYIKLAEHSYDTSKNIKRKFHTFLSKNELALLIKSYGCPQRYRNAKEYYTCMNDLNVKNAESLWKKLSETEQDEYREKYAKYCTDYILQMFRFSRDLPESRVDDFLAYIEVESEKKILNKLPPTNIKEVLGDPKQIKLFKYQFAPYEFYYEDNKDKYKDEISLHLNKVKARKNYIKLDEQSKLIYLKKCEKAFDHFDFRVVDDHKPMLSYILNKDEMRILLNSYGMPKKVGVNPTSYYYMLHCKNYKEDKMKNVMLDWGKLDDAAKNDFAALHAKDVESYIERKKKFENDLPKQRLIDLEYLERKEPEITIPEIKPIKKKSQKSPKVESNEIDNPSNGHESNHDKCNSDKDDSDREELNLEELDKRVSFAKVVEQLSTEEYYFENAFSYFVNEKLKSQQKMDQTESAAFLKKVTKEWSKLEEADKEDFESKTKKSKKDFKKSYKKVLENHSDITLEIEEVKRLIKSHARQINVKLDEQTVEELVLSDKTVASLIDPTINEFEAKSKKPKEVAENDHKPDKKRKSNNSVSDEKVKKSKPAKNEGLGFE